MSIRTSTRAVRLFSDTVFRPLATSWRYRAHHADRWRRLAHGERPFIFLLWHEALLPLLWLHRGQQIAIVVSDGLEGRYLASYATRIGYRPLTGSSSRGALAALRGAIRTLRTGAPVAFTPDGPRGPRRTVKPGIIRAAQRADALILPLHAVPTKAWSLGSWDRMMVPKPFARVDVAYGEPFAVEPGRHAVPAGIERCTNALNSLERSLAG
ncbi:MAG: lysophospholipid acyltransferase family protein [Gemmatimonadales bacterium]